jgi:hypothetical protein
MKKIILLSIATFCASYTWALTTITTGTITGNPFCGGSTVTVPYTVDAPAGGANVFTAQLSDKNGNFTNPVNIGSVQKKGAGTIMATLPVGSQSGTKYRIRVVSSNPVVIGSPNTSNLAVNPQPTGVKVNSISACDAQLKWNAQANASSFEVRTKLTSSGDWGATINVGLATTYTFSALKANSSYDFQVRAKCSNNEKSSWKQISGSTTAPLSPTGGTVTVIGITTTTVDWNDMACAGTYRLRYKESTSGTWQKYLNYSSSIANLTGLFPATDYTAQVATITASNDSSAYSGNIQWVTNYFKLSSTEEISSMNLYPNPSNGTFTMQLQSEIEGATAEITVQNIYGQVVYSEKKILKSGLNEEVISMMNVQKGIYLVRVHTGSGVTDATITIQ